MTQNRHFEKLTSLCKIIFRKFDLLLVSKIEFIGIKFESGINWYIYFKKKSQQKWSNMIVEPHGKMKN